MEELKKYIKRLVNYIDQEEKKKAQYEFKTQLKHYSEEYDKIYFELEGLISDLQEVCHPNFVLEKKDNINSLIRYIQSTIKLLIFYKNLEKDLKGKGYEALMNKFGE